jgi:hypothetical protein
VAAGVLSGRVLDPGGAPVAGARVVVTASPGPVPDVAQLTGTDGRFSTPAPRPGAYRIAAYADGFAATEAAVDVPAAGGPPAVEITLGREESGPRGVRSC